MCHSTTTDAASPVLHARIPGDDLLRCDWFALTVPGFYVHPNGPDESEELATHGRHHLLLAFALGEQVAITGV